MDTVYLISQMDLINLIDSYSDVLFELSKYITDPNSVKQMKYPDEFIYKMEGAASDVKGIKQLMDKLKNVHTKLINQWESCGYDIISEYEIADDIDLDTEHKKSTFLNKCGYKIQTLVMQNMYNIIDILTNEFSLGIEKILIYLVNENSVSMYERIDAYSWCVHLVDHILIRLKEKIINVQNEIERLSDKEAFCEHFYFRTQG